MKVRLVGDKIQEIEVNESLLAFLEIVGDRCGDVIVIDPLRVLYMAYESIRFNELLDKLYMLECCLMSVELKKIIEQERVSYPDKERFFTVLGLLLSDRISIGKASELLGLRVDDLLLLMHKLGIKYSILDEEEIKEELNAYRRVFKSST